MYRVVNNAIELIAGTNNTTSPLYIEAAKSIESDTPKAMGTMKKFITAIENIADKGNVKDKRISDSRGNISQFTGYEDIKVAIDFLSKNLSGLGVVKDLTSIFQCLEVCQSEYADGYNKQVRLIILEYEAAVYMLVTGLSYAMANNIDIKQNGTQIRVTKKAGNDGGVINKTVSDLAKQLKSKGHKEYLKELAKARISAPVSESVDGHLITELTGAIADTIDVFTNIASGAINVGKFVGRTFKTLKRTMFGIIPMIRTALYLRYKKKADTILALEQQIYFVKMNINQLENMKTMDEAKKKQIIKKQQAAIEVFQKKAEKLRAQLIETEKAAATSMKEDEPELGKDSSDEFIL